MNTFMVMKTRRKRLAWFGRKSENDDDDNNSDTEYKKGTNGKPTKM